MKKLLILVCSLALLCALLCACDGESAYDIAVRNGFQGTEAEWLESLKGDNGATGADAIAPQIRINDLTNEWEVSTDGGNTWVTTGVKATGEKGETGAAGTQGPQGATGATGADAVAPQIRINDLTNEWEVSTDGGNTWVTTGVKATGEDGKDYDYENPQGLDFFLLPDDTYTVGIGKALYAKEITIPATYKGKAVTCVGLPSSSDDNDLAEIYGIGFWCSSYLEKIHLPEGITTIGPYAFYQCTSLAEITIPESVKEISPSAFSGCENLEKVQFLGAIENIDIDKSAFYGCDKLSPAAPEITLTANGTLTWAPVDGADYYEIRIDYGDNIIKLTDCEFTAIQEGSHNYFVRAVKGVFPSDWASLSVNKLSPVLAETITYDSSYIRWSSVNGTYQYEVTVNGVVIAENCEGTSLAFDAQNQDFEVRIRTLPDPSYYYGSGTTIKSELSEAKRFINRPTVTNVRVVNGNIVWDPVEGAIGYDVNISKFDEYGNRYYEFVSQPPIGETYIKPLYTDCVYTDTAYENRIQIRPLFEDTRYYANWSAEQIIYIPS